MALKDQLGKMIGPLPMGAWLAIVAGGLGFAYYYRNQSTAAAPVAMDDTTTDSGAGVGSGYVVDTSGTGSTSTAPADNDAWAAGAVQWLSAHAYDPLVASSAVSKYLAGESLSAQEAAMVRTVISQYGSPPSVPTTPTPKTTAATPVFTPVTTTTPKGVWYVKAAVRGRNNKGVSTGPTRPVGFKVTVAQWGQINGVMYAKSQTFYYPQSALQQANPHPVKPPKPAPPHPTVKKPAPKPQAPKAPAKPKVRTYTVKHGDTLSGIAHKFGVRWQSIYKANTNKIKNPNLIQPGWVLVIPNS